MLLSITYIGTHFCTSTCNVQELWISKKLWINKVKLQQFSMTVHSQVNLNKRPRGLDACQQHCKISATDVSDNVYLCSKMQYHENKICVGR